MLTGLSPTGTTQNPYYPKSNLTHKVDYVLPLNNMKCFSGRDAWFYPGWMCHMHFILLRKRLQWKIKTAWSSANQVVAHYLAYTSTTQKAGSAGSVQEIKTIYSRCKTHRLSNVADNNLLRHTVAVRRQFALQRKPLQSSSMNSFIVEQNVELIRHITEIRAPKDAELVYIGEVARNLRESGYGCVGHCFLLVVHE